MSHRHSIRVRYGECDMQQVVFNANYLAYVDDAIDTWMRTTIGGYEAAGFDCMVKRIEIEWQTPARFGDTVDLDLEVTRWGRTSFDVGVVGSVEDRPSFSATVVYVSTTPGAPVPAPVPELVKKALGGAGA
jgi:acyl-CoA thioester hydrolase